MPSVDIPNVNLNDMLASSGIPPEAGLAGAGILVLAVLIGAASGGDDTAETAPGVPPPKRSSRGGKFDVSIPYDAAARLAYDEWIASQQGVRPSEASFHSFQAEYLETCIALVSAKQKARNLANFDPRKPKPAAAVVAPPKQAAPEKKTKKAYPSVTTTETPFFASEV